MIKPTKSVSKEIQLLIRNQNSMERFLGPLLDVVNAEGSLDYKKMDFECLPGLVRDFKIPENQMKYMLALLEIIMFNYPGVPMENLMGLIITCFSENLTEYTVEDMTKNPYLKNIKLHEAKKGKFSLTHDTFYDGEPFFDKCGNGDINFNFPHFGFFSENFTFPCIKEDDSVWMSITPNEINTMQEPIDKAHGKVVTFGMGLGYFAYMAHLKEDVESIRIIEKEQDVITLFKENILPQFPYPEKIRIIKADALEYVKDMHDVDFVFCDIWESPFDGLFYYLKLVKYEKQYKGVDFFYWIEDEIISTIRTFLIVKIFVSVSYSIESDIPIEYEELLAPIFSVLKKERIESDKDIHRVLSTDFIKKIIRKIK